MTLLDNVKKYCEQRDVTIHALARAIGVDPSTVFRWKYDRGVDYRVLARVAVALHVLLDDLVEEVEIGDLHKEELYR